MKRTSAVLGAALAAVVGLIGAPGASAYPVAPTVSVDAHVVLPGQTVTLSINGFCGPTVNVSISGASNLGLGDIALAASINFNAPGILGAYTVTVTGATTCSEDGQPLDGTEGAASDTFAVVAAQVAGPSATPSTTGTTIADGVGAPAPSSSTPVEGVGAAGTGSDLPRTGTDSLSTLQIALTLAAGGCLLVVVARTRHQRRRAAA